MLLQIEAMIAHWELTGCVAQNPIVLLVVHVIIGDNETFSLEELVIGRSRLSIVHAAVYLLQIAILKGVFGC